MTSTTTPLLPNTTLWIGDLEKWMDEAYLSTLFVSSTKTRVVRYKLNSFGFVEFGTNEEAANALGKWKGKTMPNSEKPFKLNWATQSPPQKQPEKTPNSRVQKPESKQSQSNSTWADRIKISDSSTRFNLSPVNTKVVDDVLIIPDEVIADSHLEWTRCLVGYFPGYTMPFHAAKTVAFRAWKSDGLEDVTSTGTGFLIFRFQTEEAIHSILERGPWMFGGRTIILQQWHAQISFDRSKISKIPVWTRLHGIPMPLWTPQGLSQISSMIGRPLSCDKTTSERTRLFYARVCVEIDAADPPKHQVLIQSSLSKDPITVTVEYEWKPSRCPKCRVFGHFCKEAPSAPKTTQVYVPVASSSQIPPSEVPQTPRPEVTQEPPVLPLAVPVITDGGDGQSSDSDTDRDTDSLHPLETDQDSLMLPPCILSREHTSPFSRDSPLQASDSTPLPIQVIYEAPSPPAIPAAPPISKGKGRKKKGKGHSPR